MRIAMVTPHDKPTPGKARVASAPFYAWRMQLAQQSPNDAGYTSAATFELWHNRSLSTQLCLFPMPDPDVDFASGISAFESREFAKALKFLSPFAEQGNAEAQYRMAIMYQNGLGMVRNDARALAMMRAAAEQGHALAQHGLGFMYLQGECTPKDEAQAAEWFRKAADQGMAGSQMTLGMMYEQGLGVEKDPDAAKRWYQLASGG